MKKLLTLLLCLFATQSLFAWGQKGHDVTAYIAECHLTPEAAEKIDKLIGGHSLVYYANWLDIASHRPEYAYTKTWHYLNIDEGHTLESMPKNPAGSVLTAIESIVKKLKTGALSPDEELLNIKILIHLVGDMHCPMHLGRLSDLGGNQRRVTFFNSPSNLHSAWDSSIVESAHRWGYTEWQDQIDRLTDDQIVLIQAGDPSDWIRETHKICTEIYDSTPDGTKISYEYIDKYTPVIERQFVRGGYRLARLLNEIYQ